MALEIRIKMNQYVWGDFPMMFYKHMSELLLFIASGMQDIQDTEEIIDPKSWRNKV